MLASPAGSSAQERAVSILDVPFMAQTVDLCGGAAAAMVLRYWGDPDVQASDFASLVDRSKGGIETQALTHAIAARGVEAIPVEAHDADVLREVEAGRPVIALIAAGSGRYHYVVIVAWTLGRVVFHDPSVGPFQVKTQAEFSRLWGPSRRWALVLAPRASPRVVPTPTPAPSDAEMRPAGKCDALIDPAIALGRGSIPELAVPSLLAAIELCPEEPRARVALAGVRFRQERWGDAATVAREAAALDDKDADTWRLLATSLYLSGAHRPAVEAWNHAGEPRIDRIQIDGLVRTRQDVASAVLGLRPREVLTPHSLLTAERRLAHLPTSSGARVTYRPVAGGRADIVASVRERSLIERWPLLFLRLALDGAGKRQAELNINSPTGRGEQVEVGGRFASNRPALWVSIETPGLFGLPGVVLLSGLWDRQTYRPETLAPGTSPVVENRRRGSAGWSHWMSGSARGEVEIGVDRFAGRGTFASLRAGAEGRFANDRIALIGDVAAWAPMAEEDGFREVGGSVVFRSRVSTDRPALHGRIDYRSASLDAPFALWPGAGTGGGRPYLLRASRLHGNGEMTGDAFGRRLLHTSIEFERPVFTRGPARFALAVFADWAKVWDRPLQAGAAPGIWAFGLGIRARSGSTAFRVDVARRPDRKGLVLSGGVIRAWPR